MIALDSERRASHHQYQRLLSRPLAPAAAHPLDCCEPLHRCFQELAPREPCVHSIPTFAHGSISGSFVHPLQQLHFRLSVVRFSLALEALPTTVRVSKSTVLIVVLEDVDRIKCNMTTEGHRMSHCPLHVVASTFAKAWSQSLRLEELQSKHGAIQQSRKKRIRKQVIFISA